MERTQPNSRYILSCVLAYNIYGPRLELHMLAIYPYRPLFPPPRTAMHVLRRWWSGVAVARWSRSTKLTYVGPD